MTITNTVNGMYQKAKSALQKMPVGTIALIFFILGGLVTAFLFGTSKEESMTRTTISIIALILSFTAFLITRMDKASRDKYEISQIYFNEAKNVLEKSINGVCEEEHNNLAGNWKTQSYSLNTYYKLKEKINNIAHIDSLEIHETNSRNRITSFLKTGKKGGKIESTQFLPSGISKEELLNSIIPIYLFANAQDQKENTISIIKEIESLTDSSEFYSVTAALLKLKE